MFESVSHVERLLKTLVWPVTWRKFEPCTSQRQG